MRQGMMNIQESGMDLIKRILAIIVLVLIGIACVGVFWPKGPDPVYEVMQ